MGQQIEDGTGKGYKLKVDSTNKSLTRATTEPTDIEALKKGNHFAITSGPVVLTGTAENAMLFVKNTGDSDILVDRVIINTDDSTGGSVDQLILTVRFGTTAMTSGSGNETTPVNTNLGSSNSLTIESEKGADGATCDGDVAGGWRIENPTRNRLVNVRWLIPKGSSFSISYTPPADNTSMLAVAAVNAYIPEGD